MESKRVFILGAGFSKPAGMPLATELTQLVLDTPRLKGLGEMQEWLSDFQNRLKAAEGAGVDFSLNVEQLFDYAKYDEELWRMRQQLAPVGRHAGQTPWNLAHAVSCWLSYIGEELVHVIWRAQRGAKLESIQRLTDHLRETDTVVTFNYDTLVEMALSASGKAWNHGLNDASSGGTAVLKMHGSIDWLMLERRPENELEKFVKLFSKSDADVEDTDATPPDEEEYRWELWRAKDSSTADAVMDMDDMGLSNFRCQIGVTGLGRYKPLHRLCGSAQTWMTAFRALKEAEEVYVVGFSMSPYDSMTRFHFTGAVTTRGEPFHSIRIVDPGALRLAPTYHAVLGQPLTLLADSAENVDWRALLA